MTERKCADCGRPFEHDPDTGLVTYWRIKNGKPLCKTCAIKIKGKCPVCGEIKGMCIHAQGFCLNSNEQSGGKQMTITRIRAIDFFKIAKASGHSVDDVIKAWDGKKHIISDDLEDYLRSWSDRIREINK